MNLKVNAPKSLIMIDLTKLQEKFDSFFEQETEDSFNKWLQDKKKREIMAYLGLGEIEVMKTRRPTIHNGLFIKPIILFLGDTKNNIIGNTQYAMAA